MSVVSLADAKQHLRIDEDDEDALIAGLIMAAEDHIERSTGLVLTRRVIGEVIQGFGSKIRAWPVVSVDTVSYVDGAGVDQTIGADSYKLVGAARPARLSNVSSPWPPLGRLNGSVTLTMTAGFGNAADVPGGVAQAIKMLVGHFYRNREAVVTAGTPLQVPMAVDMLLEPHRPRAL